MSRETYIVGNWKMNQNLEEIKTFIGEALPKLSGKNGNWWIAPQSIHIPTLLEKSKDTIKVGAQNCSYETHGAYTGEISPISLKDLGAHFVILGHSERRAIFKETDQELNLKLKQALKAGLTIIFCVGETLAEREAGKVDEVLATQVFEGLRGVELNSKSDLIIAYEPVWAIGTGKTATPEMADEAHQIIRKHLFELENIDAEATSILYGGSVKPNNIEELLEKENIDGALVGGASLKAQDYVALCNTNC